MSNETPSSRRQPSKLVPWLALFGLLALAFIVLTPFLVPLAWAGMLSYASWPVATRIRQWCKGRDTLAASISTALAAIMLFLPLIWLVWIAQKELANVFPALQAFFAAPIYVSESLKSVPWLGDWLTQQAGLLADPQGISAAIKA